MSTPADEFAQRVEDRRAALAKAATPAGPPADWDTRSPLVGVGSVRVTGNMVSLKPKGAEANPLDNATTTRVSIIVNGFPGVMDVYTATPPYILAT